jgi:hypothetical protein
MLRWLGWLFILALGYGVICAVMALTQRSLTYHPRPAADPSGQLELQVGGTRVLVAHRPHAGPRALIYFGGNAEDGSLTRAQLAALVPDTALYLLHSRGYGGSEGLPSESALRADALALHAHVAQRHRVISVVGSSLGTAWCSWCLSTAWLRWPAVPCPGCLWTCCCGIAGTQRPRPCTVISPLAWLNWWWTLLCTTTPLCWTLGPSGSPCRPADSSAALSCVPSGSTVCCGTTPGPPG